MVDRDLVGTDLNLEWHLWLALGVSGTVDAMARRRLRPPCNSNRILGRLAIVLVEHACRSAAPIQCALRTAPAPDGTSADSCTRRERFAEARIRLWPERCSHGLVA